MMKRIFFLFAMAFSALLFTTSCDNADGDRDGDADTTVGTNDQWMQERDTYIGERRDETRGYEERRQEWGQRAEAEKDTARQRQIRTKLNELDREMQELSQRLDRSADQTEENWDQFKKDLDKDLQDVKSKIEEIEKDLDESSGNVDQTDDTEDDDTRS